MATSTFDRPLVLEKDEDIERFWYVMNNVKPQPIYLDKDFRRKMDEWADAFDQMVENTHSRCAE